MIQAVIFDLDGTVLDNEGVWEDVFRQVAHDNNIPIATEPGKWFHTPGIGVLSNWRRVVGDLVLAQTLTTQTKKLYQDLTRTDEVMVMDGLVELIEAVKEKGWQTALATSSDWHSVESQLEELNLQLAFEVTTTGEEVLAPKPDPEIYLLTVQKLGLEPENCVVIEDAVAGVQSAVEAGCLTIGLSSEQATAKMLTAAGAELVVDNLSEVMLRLLAYGDKDKKKSH